MDGVRDRPYDRLSCHECDFNFDGLTDQANRDATLDSIKFKGSSLSFEGLDGHVPQP